jgi:AbrB family transcriptional regulator (stage V sporulation protein T)
MEERRLYAAGEQAALPILESSEEPCISVAAPIISAGDVLGCVLFAAPKYAALHGDTEQKLVQTVASFLGKQMEE